MTVKKNQNRCGLGGLHSVSFAVLLDFLLIKTGNEKAISFWSSRVSLWLCLRRKLLIAGVRRQLAFQL